MGTESEGLGKRNLEVNTELRHSAAFSRAESAVLPFEERGGMEGEQTPETDFTRCHQILEKGDKFESSFLRFGRCCFVPLLRMDTHLLRTFWNALRLPSVRFAFPEEKASCFREPALPQHSVYLGWGKKVRIIEDAMGLICIR